MGGMIWVDGLHGAPIAFLVMSAASRSLDPAYTESAPVSGAGRVAVLRRIELPMLAPAWGQAGLLLFLHAIESLEAPSFLGVPAGIPAFTSAIVLAVKRDPGDLGPACALSIPLLAITLVALWPARRCGCRRAAARRSCPGSRVPTCTSTARRCRRAFPAVRRRA